VLSDGTVVSGTSVESYRSWAVWIERSTDQGITWIKSGPITVPPEVWGPGVEGGAPAEVPGSSEWNVTEGIIQPTVVALSETRLRLYARSTARIGKICIADSGDRGMTWTHARPIDLPNPNSGIDAVTLANGKVVLIYNHSSCERTPLNLAVSDEGEHFRMFHVLEDQPGEYSYPAMIRGRCGELHVTYTWNRSRIRYVRIPSDRLAALS
jgi:predicted neuraminidase